MGKAKRKRVARQLTYGNGLDDDGGAGVREPRHPLPPSPVNGAGSLTLPESIIAVELPEPPVH